MSIRWVPVLAACLTTVGIAAAAASEALADLEVTVPNRSRIFAAFSEAGEAHGYRIVCPAGAVVSVRASAVDGGPRLAVRFQGVTDSTGTSVGGPSTVRAEATAGASGALVVQVAAADGVSTGAYRLALAWRSPREFTQVATVGAGADGALGFSADEGAIALVTLRALPRSPAHPLAESLLRPDGEVVPLRRARHVESRLPLPGDYSLRWSGGAVGGEVAVRVRVRPPHLRRFRLDVGAAAFPRGVAIVAAERIGPSGGSLRVEAGPLSGTTVSVPPGALAETRYVFVGVGPSLVGETPGAAAGPGVLVGPEGLLLAPGRPAEVTIPYDRDLAGAAASSLTVVARDVHGAVGAIEAWTIDGERGRVHFAAQRLDAFQAVLPFRVAEVQRIDDGPDSVQAVLGGAVALSGDLLAAREYDETDADLGRVPLANVAVYRRCGAAFELETRLYAPPPTVNDGFGASISASGGRVAVGAIFRRQADHAATGATFVFERDAQAAWSSGTELFAAGSNAHAAVGRSVALDGDTLLVGAPRDDAAGPTAGAAHLFVRDPRTDEWAQVQTLRPDAPSANGQFGTAVALQGSVAVVGAPSEPAVYVFRRCGTTWTQTARLGAPDAAADGAFGGSVVIDHGTIVVGVVPNRVDRSSPGGVRVFREDGEAYREVARFGAPDVLVPGEPADIALGASLALQGDLLIAGAPTASVLPAGSADDPLSGSGNAFVFRRDRGAWRYAARLRGRPDDRFPIDRFHQFGCAVTLDGGTAVLGSQYDDALKLTGGALFVFDFTGR